ncbi:alpha/beta hydrolase [Inquilinus limosus]|uniref:alpha/beta fold hydrolase n=1 Tax=Inquilinus limosus TaxID=171674 RepID=UPI003F18467A
MAHEPAGPGAMVRQRPAGLAAALSVGAVLAAAILADRWRSLRRTPAVTEEARRAGIEGRVTAAGPYRMFSRVTTSPPAASGCLPVILVHGLVISSRYMEPLAQALAPAFPVLAPDLPGSGESDKPPRPLDLAGLADALHSWLDASGIARAAFIGNSFGCQVLAVLAVRHAEVVDRLVLQAPTTDPEARSLPVQIWRALVNGRREPGGIRRVARIDYAKAGLPRAFASMRILIRDRIEDRLPLITAPTLVVRGSRDPVVPQAWAERAAALLPNGRLVVVEGGTHTMNYAYPDEMARAILPFLLAERAALLHGRSG